jgi:TRAP transporter 4TM/12TM fusion protein
MAQTETISTLETHEPPLRSPIARAMEHTLAALLTVLSILWALDLITAAGIEIYDTQFYGAMLTLALPLAYIVFPARRRAPRPRVPWYDWALAALSFLGSGWLILRYDALADLVLAAPPLVVVVAVVTMALALEALRRVSGWTLVIMSLIFIAYALFGDVIPGRMGAQEIGFTQLVPYLMLDINGVLGSALAVACTIVIIYVFFGHLLNLSGGADFFTDLALVCLGRMRGGPAKVAVVSSALMGTISGSAVANVVAGGSVTIPMIQRSGYPPHKAAAIEAVASTGGQLMPPVMGASAFLMAEFLAIPYSAVISAALVPGILYYLALFFEADLDAGRRGAGVVERAIIPALRTVLGGLHFVLPFVALIVALSTFGQSPQKAALAACVVTVASAFLFGYAGRRPNWRALLTAFHTAGMASLEIILICVAAGIVIGVLSISGLSFNLTYLLVQVGGDNLVLLLILAAIVSIILGMGLPTVGVYVLLAALVAPAIIGAGVEPIAAHLYVIYFGMMSMITPPIAIAAFAAAGLINADPMKTAWASVTFGWSAYIVPILFVLSPALLLMGGPMEIGIAVATTALGIWLVSAAIIGFHLRVLPAPLRVLFGVAGILCMVPAGAFTGGRYLEAIGVAAGAALIGYEYWSRRRRALAV